MAYFLKFVIFFIILNVSNTNSSGNTYKYYKIKQTDTCESIRKLFKLTIEDLEAYNTYIDCKNLQKNTFLRIQKLPSRLPTILGTIFGILVTLLIAGSIIFFVLFKLKLLCKEESPESDEPLVPYDVFISYSHDDKRLAYNIYNILKNDENNLKVWIDKDNLKPGGDLGSLITRGLRGSKVVLSITSKKYINSDSCYKEFKLAVTLKKTVILVMIEKIKVEETRLGYDASPLIRCNLYKVGDKDDLSQSEEFKGMLQAIHDDIKKPTQS